jgi:hypothetical protein
MLTIDVLLYETYRALRLWSDHDAYCRVARIAITEIAKMELHDKQVKDFEEAYGHAKLASQPTEQSSR